MLRLLDLTLPTPEENLALDEALLIALEESAGEAHPAPEREVLRFWESPVHFVALGASGKWREEVEIEACCRSGVPILRRGSGGGTVLQGPGCLNFSLVLSFASRPELRDVRASFGSILGRAAESLDLPGIRLCGVSDLAIEEMKISGSAQKRTRHGLLHHGTVLHRLDLTLMARVLREPARQPPYRRYRPHRDFVRNAPLEREEILERLSGAWGARAPFPSSLLPGTRRLVEEKYGNRVWIEKF